MRTHQQGKAGAGKLRTTIFSIIVVLIMLFGAAITLVTTVPAKADTGGYPYASIACVWPPYAITGKGNWCKKVVGGKIVSEYDWGTIHNDNSSKSEQSPYGYDYRNCTDYVAWKVASLGVLPAQYKGLGNAKDWPTKAPGKGLTVNTTPAIGAAAVKTTGLFGHVAFISAYNSSTGVMTVQEYNHYQDGNYGTRSGTLSNLGFSKVVHFEKYEKGGGKLDWRYQTGGPIIASSPVVVNGVVYVGSEDDYVYALNASNGGLLWRYQTGDILYGSPAVVNGVVYIGSADSYVYALNASSGGLLWRYQTGSGVISTPAVVNGVVYVGSKDDYVYALDASNGGLLWRYQTGDWVSSPAVVNGVVYVGSDDDYMYALNASNGGLLWRYQAGFSFGFGSPAVVNGVVYAGSSDGYVYALDASNGGLLWRYQTGDAVASSPAVVNGVVYVGSDDSYMYALNASNGGLLWRYQTGGPIISSSPAVVNGVVYVGSEDDYVYALNASSGGLLWRYQTGSAVDCLPAVVNGVVYVGSADSYVYALTT